MDFHTGVSYSPELFNQYSVSLPLCHEVNFREPARTSNTGEENSCNRLVKNQHHVPSPQIRPSCAHFGSQKIASQMSVNVKSETMPGEYDLPHIYDTYNQQKYFWMTRLEPPKLDFSDNIAQSILEEEVDFGYSSFGDRSPCSYTSNTSDSLVEEVSDSETQPVISKELDELLDDLVSVVKEMSERESSTCRICGDMFHSFTAKNNHMRSHRESRARPYECEYCGKCFSAKSALKTHVRKHTGEKPYICQYCFRSFADRSTQKKHLRIHTGEKPFTCDICGLKFSQSGNMARHKLTHRKGK